MSDPAWSQGFILQDGANFTFPDFQTCTHANTGSCQITALSAIKSTAGWTYYEVHCTVDSSTTYIGVGFLAESIALQTTQNIRANPSQGSCSWVEDHSGGASGGVYNNGSEVLSGPNLPNPTFVIGVLVNGTEGIWGYTVDGTNWNGTNTAAQIVAGTGAITMGYAGSYLPFISAQDYEGSNVAFTASIYASSANCTYALPTGAAYLAASPILTVSSATCLPGDAVQIDWTAANTPVPAGLNYLLDSGSPTACSGSVTGTAGTAIGPTLSSGFHSIAIQDPTSLSESNWTGFYVSNPPSGAGALVYESSGTSLSSVAVTFTVDLPIGFAFDFYMQGQSTSGTIQLTGGNDFGLSGAGTQTPNYTTGGGFSDPALPDYTPENQNGWIGVAPATGPTYASVTTSTSVQGSVSLVDGEDGAGTLTATITNNGSVSTYSHVVENYAPFTLGFIDSSTGFPGHDTTYSYYLGIYTPAGPETLTLSTANGTYGGTLSITGSYTNQKPTNVNISLDDGSTFTEATAFSATGGGESGTFAASGGALSTPGTFEVVAQDSVNTTATTNAIELVVEVPVESISLTAASYFEGTLTVAGDILDATLTSLGIRFNAGASYLEATTGPTITGSLYSGTLVETLDDGAYPIQTSDLSTGVQSNVLTVTVNPQALVLSTATGTLGGTLSLTGSYAFGEPAALDYSLDAGDTFADAASYTPTGSSTAGSFSATGDTLNEAGLLHVMVRDHDRPYVESNIVTLAVAEAGAETITLTIAAGVAGGLLELAGISNNGPPPGLVVTLNAGATFNPVSNYSTEPEATDAAFAGSGPTLAVGVYQIFVTDLSQDPPVDSNTIELVVTSKGGGTGGFGSGVIPAWTAADFAGVFMWLFPRGRAWPKFLTSVQAQVWSALAPSLSRLCASAAGLLVDGFPATTVHLIPEWNASLGLPDGCTPAGSTLAQQQAAILQKFTTAGSQSVPYYIAVAALLGYDITITEQAADTFTWTVHAPQIAPPVLFRAGLSVAGDPLERIVSNAQLECVLQKLKPAHTTLIFSYP